MIEQLAPRLAAFPSALLALLDGLDDTDARCRPPNGAWSIVEIINHIADEDEEDFGTRLRMTLEDPSNAWPGIDPEAAARERNYNGRSLGESLDRFAKTRAGWVKWLCLLENPDWARAYTHPKLGDIAAGDLFAAWCDHDTLHLRQIAKRLHELVGVHTPGFSPSYAGEW